MIKGFIFLCIIFDIFLIGISLYKGGFWIINTQIAFIASMLIVLSSFYSYKKMIDAKSSLFDKDDFDEEKEDKEIIKTTRKTAHTLRASLSPLRILSYLVLILGFLWLNRQGWLEVMPFLLGLAVVPLGSLVLGFRGVLLRIDKT
ncbi:MAG: hypothetical protein CR967_04895 [Proteobacteria bacterium]|nr:MAG: hypothetical protein CR967_04895 [Pseudomonadota bacterium]